MLKIQIYIQHLLKMEADTHQRALQVESLGVLTQQHHILLQVVQAAVLMAADSLLMEHKVAVRNGLLDKKHPQKRTWKTFFFKSHLDLPEVHWFADELVVLWQLLARRQLDEDFA